MQCCRCADNHWKEFCFFCISQQQKEAADGEKQHAMNNKRKAAEELSKTDQELNAARQEQQTVTGKLERIQKTIRDMEEKQARVEEEQARLEEEQARIEEERARLEEARKALDASIAEAKQEEAQTGGDAERQGQRIRELEGNKKRRRTEELDATRVLEEVDKLLSPSRQKSHPAYWRLECDPDTYPKTEYPELEPAERAFFQELIQKCCHKQCNLSSVRDSEVLR
eukprot:3018108-Rhodomonas_salina.1